MKRVEAEITLRNEADVSEHREGRILEENIRRLTVNAVADTGAMSLYIEEETCRKLGLDIEGTCLVRVANSKPVSCKVTSPVRIRWKDRYTVCQARVMPGIAHTLLGRIPLGGMDLMVDPTHQQLVGVHGDEYEEEV